MSRDYLQFPPRHQPLREDILALSELTEQVVQEQGGEELALTVIEDRRLAVDRREGSAAAAEALEVRIRGRKPEQAASLIRAISLWFQVINVAEKVQRIRRRRQYFREDSDKPQPGGIEDAFAELKAQGLGCEDVCKLLATLSIEPVLIAHPVESPRRTILRRQQRIAKLLLERSNPLLTPRESADLWEQVRCEMTTDWQTADHPRERLTVADEREHAVFYLGEVFYSIVPRFYEELAAALTKVYGEAARNVELPLMLRFGTWVGGDMQASLDVNAKSIRETLARQQQLIINAYFSECQELAQRLSQSAGRISASAALLRRIEEYRVRLPGTQGITPARHDLMPYRVFLGQVAERLRLTYDGRALAYERPGQFRDDIALIATSLGENRGAHAGLRAVRQLLWRIDTFGFHVATLDLRQHASVHHEVLAQGLDDPQWTEHSPEQRHARLFEVLDRDIGPSGVFDALGRRTLAVFDAMMQARHRYGADSIGLYIVGGASGADDVLAPLVLARWAKAYERKSGEAAIDVAPQFDAVDTLENSGVVMRQLLEGHVYRRHLDARGRQQTVLIGYAASNRESGLLAARVAAYRAQRILTRTLREAREDHVIFYSRGGSIAGGGGRIDAMLRAAPAESVSGVLRFTEQGESTSQSYGLRSNAMRTLERACNVLARATLAVRRGVAVQEGAAMAECATIAATQSRAEWRELVHTGSRFYDYFRAVTPIDVIERMQVGSYLNPRALRPGVDTVPASVWVYAWSQSRHMLPGWFGSGAGLQAVRNERGIEALRRCYRGWPFFRNLIDDIEVMLALTDLEIAAHYDALAPVDLRGYTAQIRAEYLRTCELVLEIKESKALLDSDQTLQRAIALRNPYEDPVNLMQVDLLRRWRASGREDRALFEALLASVSGVARGLQTTG